MFQEYAYFESLLSLSHVSLSVTLRNITRPYSPTRPDVAIIPQGNMIFTQAYATMEDPNP